MGHFLHVEIHINCSIHYYTSSLCLPLLMTVSAVNMEHLHYLTGCLGILSLRMAEFYETYHNLLTCLSCPPVPRCFFSQKELCDALAHRFLCFFFLLFLFFSSFC